MDKWGENISKYAMTAYLSNLFDSIKYIWYKIP